MNFVLSWVEHDKSFITVGPVWSVNLLFAHAFPVVFDLFPELKGRLFSFFQAASLPMSIIIIGVGDADFGGE